MPCTCSRSVEARRERERDTHVEVGVERLKSGMAVIALLATVAACGARETAGRVADSSSARTTTTSTAPGDVALPAMASRSAAWLPPGAGSGDWLMPSRDYAGTRYSPLAEVNTGNVAQLQL